MTTPRRSPMSITPDQDPIFTLTTGPVDAYPRVLRGLSRPVLYDYDPAFLAFYERTAEKLRTAMRTRMPSAAQSLPTSRPIPPAPTMHAVLPSSSNGR